MVRFRSFPVLGAGMLLAAASCAQLPAGILLIGTVPPGDVAAPYRPAPSGKPTDQRRILPVPSGNPSPTPAPVKTPAPPPTPVKTPAPAASDLAALESYVFTQTNAERAKVGAMALVSDPILNTLARSRSQDMVERNYFDHVTPDGKYVFDMLKALNFSYSTAGENIAMNTYPESQSAVSVMQQWMNSSGHKANILNVKYGRIGVGAWKKPSTGGIYYTQVFTN